MAPPVTHPTKLYCQPFPNRMLPYGQGLLRLSTVLHTKKYQKLPYITVYYQALPYKKG